MPAKRRKVAQGASTAAVPPKAKAAGPPPAGAKKRSNSAVSEVGTEKLVWLFSQPRAAQRLLAGLRVLGFSADAVMVMTEAKSRDVVYSWAADRARPGKVQATRLDDVRRALHFICRHEELGAESAWMLFNARFGDMNEAGPTMMDLIAEGNIARVMKNLEELVGEQGGGDNGGGGPGPDRPRDPFPPDDSIEEPVGVN
jgi:hypothetical protein